MPRRLIINIRGPNGAGKTTLARAFLAHQEKQEPPLRYVSTGGHKGGPVKEKDWPVSRCRVPGLELPVYVMGRYDVQQGGCDTDKDMDAIERVMHVASETFRDGHILFEGFVVSKSGGRWIEFAFTHQRANLGLFVWAFVRPSLKDLVARIHGRNGGKPIKEELLKGTMRTVDLIRDRVKQSFPKGQIIDLDPALPSEGAFSKLVEHLAALETNP